jgi:hypothetical protein
VALETESTCLVDLWTITGPEGDPQEIRPVCEATMTAWSVRPSDTEEATYKMTTVVPGEYEVETHFTYNAESATLKFTVAEPTLPE